MTLQRGILFLITSLLLTSCARSEFPSETSVVRSTLINGYGYNLTVEDQSIGVTLSEDGNWYLTAVSLENGDILWKSEEAWLNEYRPILASDGTYLFGDKGDSLQVYLLDGAKVLSIPHPGDLGTNPEGTRLVLENDRLFIPNGNWLYVYDVSNPVEPTLLWQSEQPKILSGVDVDERGDVYITLFAGDYEDSVFKLSGDDGRELWRSGTYHPGIDSLYTGTYAEIVLGRLVVEARSRYIAYDLQTGQKAWISDPLICDDAGYQNAYAFLIENGTIYRNSGGGSCILAADASNGKLLWTFNTSETSAPYSFGGRPAFHEGNLYATNGRLFTLNAFTGELVSLSSDERTIHSAGSYIYTYKDQIVVWGQNLTLFEPVQ